MQIKRGGVFAVIIFVPGSSKESRNEKTFLRREISVIISFWLVIKPEHWRLFHWSHGPGDGSSLRGGLFPIMQLAFFKVYGLFRFVPCNT